MLDNKIISAIIHKYNQIRHEECLGCFYESIFNVDHTCIKYCEPTDLLYFNQAIQYYRDTFQVEFTQDQLDILYKAMDEWL